MQADFPSVQMFGIKTPLVKPGDNISEIIIHHLEKQGTQ